MLRTTITIEFPPAEPVTVAAWRYRLSERASGAEAGVAAVCTEARYASVSRRGAPRLERLHLSSNQWRIVEADGPTSTLLAEQIQGERRGAIAVGNVELLAITAAPTSMVGALDGVCGFRVELR